MNIIPNNIIPFRGFLAVTIWPFIFVRWSLFHHFTPAVLRHETIHGCQQKEMLLLLFYVWYVVEWLVRLVILRDAHRAYRTISFEQEAYANELNPDYLDERRHYAWLRYLWRMPQ